MAILIRARLPLLLLLMGIVFLASASVSVGIAYWEKENPRHDKCLQSCNSENDAYRYGACQARCNLIKSAEEQSRVREEREGQQQEEERPRREEQQEGQPWRERERQREEEEEEEKRGPREHRYRHKEREQEQEREPRRERERESEEEEQEEREPREQRHRRHQEREREQERRRERQEGGEQEEEEERQRDERRRREERQREERQRRREKREQEGEREGQGSQPQRQNNPYHFGSKRFQTRYKNEHGQIRILQRFDKRSKQLRNLQNYRIVVFESKPNTLILPHHSDAEYLLVVLSGKATFTIVNPNNRESYNVERADVLRIPAGTSAYVANRDDNQNLRVAKLAMPVNRPGQFEDFFPSGSQNPQSYYNGFSRDTLEATFNTQYEEIQRFLLGEKEDEGEQQQQQRGREREQSQQEEGVIVKMSREQLRELSQHAKSISRGSKPSKSGPFNLRSLSPRYSNKFGKFFEASPEKTQLLQDLRIYVSYTELNEGGLFLPHYNSKAVVLALVLEGEGGLEIVGIQGHRKLREQREEGREEEQEEEEEEEEEEQDEKRSGQVQRITANLSQGDVFIAPAGHPIAINASSDLHVLAFGLNAENNQRNFLGGERDNVIKQIERQAKELAFPGSSEDVDSLIRNQRESYFVNAQPQQREGKQGRKGPLSSILDAFY